MTSTVENAVDEMYSLIKSTWDVNTPNCALIYDDAKAAFPNNQQPWARVTVRHNGGGEIAIRRGNGEGRYNRTGTLYVNLFCQPGDGRRLLDPLVKLVLDTYEGKTTASGIWFTKARVTELGTAPDPAYYQINVLVNFSYDEIK